MERGWPGRGPWVVAAVSADVDGRFAAAGLAAASEAPVAVVVLGGTVGDGDPIRAHAAGLLEGAGELALGQAIQVIGALTRAYDLVLVSGAAGLLVPVGSDGWTLVDLAVGLKAPVVIVTGPGDDAANHTTLALDALDGRGLTGAVVTIGDVDLPVPVAGRIPAEALNGAAPGTPSAPGAPSPPGASSGSDVPPAPETPSETDTPPAPETPSETDTPPAPETPSETDAPSAPETASGSVSEPEPGTEAVSEPDANPETAGTRAASVAGDRFAGAAGWFDPMLRATAAGTPAAAVPEGADAAARPKPVEGRRVVGALLGIFLIMVVMACGLAWCDGGSTDSYHVTTLERVPATPRTDRSSAYAAPARTRPPRPSTDVCPESRGPLTPARPDAATTARVNAAWLRIERWLARNAPKSAASLRAPAPVPRLDDLQRRMSVSFPPDLVASLRRHDGVTDMRGFSLPPFYQPMSLAQIFSEWQGNCDVMADFDIWGGEDDWWHRQYVPFGMDGSGGNLIVDQRPGHHGRVGGTDPEVGADFTRWPASVTALLEQTASALEKGQEFHGFRPVVRDGSLDWGHR